MTGRPWVNEFTKKTNALLFLKVILRLCFQTGWINSYTTADYEWALGTTAKPMVPYSTQETIVEQTSMQNFPAALFTTSDQFR